MKKYLYGLSVIIVCLLWSVSAFAEDTIHIATGEFPPIFSEYIHDYGYKAHLISEAFEFEDIRVKYRFLPWKRAYVMTRDGKFDATCCWYKTEERTQEMRFSHPVEQVSTNFFHLKHTKFDWKNLDDLKGLRIGITLGYTYPKEFMEVGRKGLFKLDEAPKDKFNVKKLLAGRIDLFPSGPVPTYTLLRKIFPRETVERFAYHPTPLISEPDYLLFSHKTDSSFIERFNNGLKQLKASGRFDQIIHDAEAGKYPIMDMKWIK